MELIRVPAIDWIGKRWAFFAASGVLMLASLGSIAVRGFNYGIDFTGGTLLQVGYSKPKALSSLREDLAKAGYSDAVPQSFSGTNSFAIRLKGRQGLDAQTLEELLRKLQGSDPANVLQVDRKEYVGPAVGRHLRRQAFWAVVFALLGIAVYVAFRFDNPVWAAAGVIAIWHDVIATAGLFSILQREVDLVIVAALLTIAGYSINDTIVIFDRLRDRLRLFRREPLGEAINHSVNETMSRTIITNGCVIGIMLVLFLFGGPVIHDFATAMLFGGLVGTYSTVAVATPLVYQWYAGRASAAPLLPVKPAAGALPPGGVGVPGTQGNRKP